MIFRKFSRSSSSRNSLLAEQPNDFRTCAIRAKIMRYCLARRQFTVFVKIVFHENRENTRLSTRLHGFRAHGIRAKIILRGYSADGFKNRSSSSIFKIPLIRLESDNREIFTK